jgi:hypothetical protein
MNAQAHSHLRLAAVDGRKRPGVRKPSPKVAGARPLPPHVVKHAESVAESIASGNETLKVLFRAISSIDGDADASAVVVIRALTRDAMTSISAAQGMSGWLAEMLDDPASLWR